MGKVPTYEEYKMAVKKSFWKDMKNLSEKEVDDYLQSEEDLIKNRYEDDIRAYNAGEFPDTVLMQGCVSSVANCLFYMY